MANRTIEARFELEGDDSELRVLRVQGREFISQLFSFDITFVRGGKPASEPRQELLGTTASLVFTKDGEEVRRLHGVVAAIEEEYDDSDAPVQRARFVPRAHFLALVKTQDVFLDMSVPQIIAQKLERYGLIAPSDVDLSGLLTKYPVREFVVQYEESDIAFISRLCEHLGISFFFDHAGDKEKVVFSDQNAAFLSPEGVGSLRVGARGDEFGIRKLRIAEQMIPAQYVVMDYNYRTPDVDLAASASAKAGFAGGVIEWGGHHKTPEEGAALATIRAEEAATQELVYRGESSVCELSAGHRYAVEGRGAFDGGELVMVEVEHLLVQSSGAGGQAEARYENTFLAVPADRTYRPPRRTPKPRIAGLVNGVVEPRYAGEVEQYARIDEQGRYVIKFLFDAAPIGERKASRPVRKAQPTVGPGYGMHFPLRPGIEVVMAFVNGDPDRPIVVGAVHNATTPAHVSAQNQDSNVIKTASGIRMTFKDN